MHLPFQDDSFKKISLLPEHTVTQRMSPAGRFVFDIVSSGTEVLKKKYSFATANGDDCNAWVGWEWGNQ